MWQYYYRVYALFMQVATDFIGSCVFRQSIDCKLAVSWLRWDTLQSRLFVGFNRDRSADPLTGLFLPLFPILGQFPRFVRKSSRRCKKRGERRLRRRRETKPRWRCANLARRRLGGRTRRRRRRKRRRWRNGLGDQSRRTNGSTRL